MFKKNVSLKQYTTFGVGGEAKYFCETTSEQEIIKAVNFAKERQLPYFILGGGSNLLISDEGFEGIVLKIGDGDYTIKNKKIVAGAGVKLKTIVTIAADNGLGGLEWAAGIPGTLGGAIRGNAGAFGSYISQSVKQVRAIDLEEGLSIKILTNKDCAFDYRNSIFKKNSLLIISADLELYYQDQRKVRAKIKEYLDYRRGKQPQYPSAGCVFKNFKDKSAGRLIEEAGLKGEQIGDAMVSKEHANFIINLGNARAKDIKELVDLVKGKVQEETGYRLEEEIQYLGF